MPTLLIEKLSKTYRIGREAVPAVRSLSLSIETGELVTVVGPSGSGKTTLLRLIAGLDQLDDGSVHIGGRLVSRLSPKDRDVAMVFQGASLYPHMSVRKNLAFGLKMRGCARHEIRQKIEAAADLLRIGHLLDRRPYQLSGGEQQRAALGRAIVRRPQVLLLDEPLSDLDAPTRLAMRTELRALHKELGVTTLHVTHDQQEAMALGDRMAVLHLGRLEQFDSPLTVYDRPANQFVAAFVGDVPMNFMEGELQRNERGAFFVAGDKIRIPLQGALSSGTHECRAVLGIRANHIRFAGHLGDATGSHASFAPAVVESVEPLGSAVNVHVRLPQNERWVVRAEAGRQPLPGQSVQPRIDLSQVHLFQTGDRGMRIELLP